MTGTIGRRLVAAITLAVSLTTLATAAHAQLGDPGTQTLDTDVTPVAKDSIEWKSVAGAQYSQDGPQPSDVPDGSATPFELDFFSVSFFDPEHGFAGGAECRERVAEGTSPDDARQYVASCERVPVIYRYSLDDVGEAAWEEVYRGDSTGFVGAIDWLGDGRALAVGGSGTYPRREQRPSTPENDPAEAGRAWLFADGSWSELTGLPAGMRGMTALDVSPRPSDCGAGSFECAAVGAFRQIWMFQNGHFTQGFTEESPDSALDRAYLFQFRVRDLEFSPSIPGGSANWIRAVAPTAGCCAADELQNGSRFLLYDGTRWYVRSPEGDPSNVSDAFYQQSQTVTPRPTDQAWDAVAGASGSQRQNVERGCTPTLGICGRTIWENGMSVGGVTVPPLEPELGPWPIPDGTLPSPQNPVKDHTDPLYDEVDRQFDAAYRERHRELDRATSPYGANTQLPDSVYALQVTNSASCPFIGGPCTNLRLVMTPGGPPSGEAGDEQASQIANARVKLQRGRGQAAILSQGVAPFSIPILPGIARNPDKLLTTLRLHDIDTTPVPMTPETPGPGMQVVGVLEATGQGAVWGPQETFPDRTHKGLHGCDTSVTPPEGCDPNAERFVSAQAGRNLFKLPSYALNSVDIVDDIFGSGWAVGDHGALLAVGAESAAQAQAREPQPPRLGQRAGTLRPGALRALPRGAHRRAGDRSTLWRGRLPAPARTPLRFGGYAGGHDEPAAESARDEPRRLGGLGVWVLWRA